MDMLFAFTGKMYDEVTGLQNNLNRWYDAKLGQWVSEDPIGFEAGDANVRRYVNGNSTLKLDSNGLQQNRSQNQSPLRSPIDPDDQYGYWDEWFRWKMNGGNPPSPEDDLNGDGWIGHPDPGYGSGIGGDPPFSNGQPVFGDMPKVGLPGLEQPIFGPPNLSPPFSGPPPSSSLPVTPPIYTRPEVDPIDPNPSPNPGNPTTPPVEALPLNNALLEMFDFKVPNLLVNPGNPSFAPGRGTIITVKPRPTIRLTPGLTPRDITDFENWDRMLILGLDAKIEIIVGDGSGSDVSVK